MKKVLLEAPILTQSGYGEHSRFVFRSISERDDIDLYIIPLAWGTTSWVMENDVERQLIDKLINKTVEYTARNENPEFHIHIHVGIPGEFKKKAPYAVHVTAGIETTKISKKWFSKTYEMNKIIVPSEHAKWVFENTVYDVENNGEKTKLACKTPIEVVPYPVRIFEPSEDFELDLEYDFNFLSVALWGVRKNMENMIKWFVEEFKNEEIGLVLKTSLSRGSLIDRDTTKRTIKNILSDYPNRKCKVYLLHGDLSNNEMKSLYNHEKIKAMITTTHGEGFGLPLFEAVINELPIVAPAWSGHLDFLRGTITTTSKGKKRTKIKDFFAKVEFTIQPVQEKAHWGDIIIPESMWCFPKEKSFKNQMKNVFKNYGMYKSWAKKNKIRVLEKFAPEIILRKMSEALIKEEELPDAEVIFVSDFFQNQLSGGAEMTLQTIINSSSTPKVIGINSHMLGKKQIEFYKDKKWIFGNISQMKSSAFDSTKELGIEYSFVEFDYKFCKYRNPALYEMVEGEECNYSETELAQKMLEFMNGASSIFFMSKKQKDIHEQCLPGFISNNSYVLSSVFTDDFFDTIDSLNKEFEGKKSEEWIVLGSESWVKGVAESEAWCKENNKKHEVVSGLSPLEFLRKLAGARGVCFKPVGLDTCPRFIIEAKLLGCELELNDNVQHTVEEWFNLDNEGIKEYLLSRPSFFWQKVFGKWNSISP